ncbi:MAG: hypothetical protein ACK4M7_09565 [Burkholderiales bacterium]
MSQRQELPAEALNLFLKMRSLSMDLEQGTDFKPLVLEFLKYSQGRLIVTQIKPYFG